MMPYRILCNDAQREGAKLSPELASRLFCCVPLHKIRYGIRFHTLMLDTSSNLGDYPHIFHLKAVHLQFLSPRERLYLADHYLNYCERTILHMQSEAQDMQRIQAEAQDTEQEAGNHADFTAAVVDILQHLAKQEQGELAWARRVRERAVAALDAEIQAQAETG